MSSIVFFNCDASLVVMEQEITGRETPHARPSAILLLNVTVIKYVLHEDKQFF
jgi:hypothetical protein